MTPRRRASTFAGAYASHACFPEQVRLALDVPSRSPLDFAGRPRIRARTGDLLLEISVGSSGGAFTGGYNSTIVAGSNGSTFTTAMVRAMSVAKSIDLDPSASTRKARGPLPNGKARKARKARGKR